MSGRVRNITGGGDDEVECPECGFVCSVDDIEDDECPECGAELP